jgi:hypothetical protein
MDPTQQDPPQQQVSIAPPDPQQTQVSIAYPDSPPPIDPTAAATTAAKAKYGIPTMEQSHVDTFQEVVAGREQQVREQAAANIDFSAALRRQQIVGEWAKQQTGPVTPIQAKTMEQFLRKNDTDPKAVFEEFYSKAYIDNLEKARQDNPDSYLNEMKILNPQAFQKTAEVATDLKAKKELAIGLQGKVAEAYQNQSWPKFGLDMAKAFIPFYSEANLRNLSGTAEGLNLSSNLDSTWSDLFRLPMAEYKKKLPAIVDGLLAGKLGGNPALAARFLQHGTDPSFSSNLIDSIFDSLDIVGLPGGGFAAGKLGLKGLTAEQQAVKAAEASVKKAFSGMVNADEQISTGYSALPRFSNTKVAPSWIADKLKDIQDIQDQGIKPNFSLLKPFEPESMAGASTTSTTKWAESKAAEIQGATSRFAVPPQFRTEEAFNPTSMSVNSWLDDVTKRIQVSAAEAAGNIQEAGIQSATREVTKAITTGADTADALRGLHSAFDTAISDFKANPRGYSQELVNRVVEGMNTTRDNLVDAIQKTVKVERIPTLLAVEKNIKLLTAKLKNDYKGIENSILDVQIRHDPVDRVHYADFIIGKDGTTPFGSEVSARNFVSKNQLAGPKAGIKSYTIERQVGKTAKAEEPSISYTKQFLQNDKGKTGFSFEVNGRKLEATISHQGEDLVVDWVGAGVEADWKDHINQLGVKNIKQLLRILKTEFPDAERVVGERATGARPIYAPQILSLENVRPFLTAEQAAKIEQSGAGYVIRMSKPIDETQPLIRSFLKTEDTTTPISWVNAWGGYLGAFRTPENTLSFEQNMNRKVATYGQSTLLKLAKDTAEDIKKLRGWNLTSAGKREKWKQWQQSVDAATSIRNPATGEMGYMFKDAGELSDFYSNTFHRLPDDQEVAAYFAYKNQRLIEQELRNLSVRTEKLRQGAQSHTIYTVDARGDRPGVKVLPTVKVQVDGTRIHSVPADGESIMFVGTKLGDEQVKNTSAIRGPQRLRVQKELDEGRGYLIKLVNPEERLFQFWNTEGTRPKYVYTKYNTDEQPLGWNHISRKITPDYEYEHYVAQPIISKDNVSKLAHYEGDRHIAAFNIRAIGKDVAEKLDGIRMLLKDGKNAEADAYHATSGLHIEMSEIRSWFAKNNVTAEGLPIPPRLSLDEAISLVPRNKNINDMGKTLADKYNSKAEFDLRDQTKDNLQRLMADQQDPHPMFAIDNKGTKSSPLYDKVPLQQIDPIKSMNRALNRAINDHYLNDYKLFSVEHWIQEAKSHLAIDDSRLASAPAYFFHNPVWKDGTPVEIKNNLMTANLQIRQFLGIQDTTQTFLHSAAQQLADSLYESGYSKLALVPAWALPKLRDPSTFVRSLAFDMHLGLFAVPQLMLQMQQFVNIGAIAGFKHAGSGTFATLLHGWSAFSKDPAILAKLDDLASKFHFPGSSRWRPGEWTEAHDGFINTGYNKVGNEYAVRDNPYGNPVVGSAGGTFLNAGRVFFNAGEKSTRAGSFYTAYREFRDVKPTGAMSNADWRQVLNRADLLNNNMSRASNSNLQRGVFSIPLQFATYPIRTAELVLSKRLTNAEKARLFGVNAALFGIPAGLSLSGAPFQDIIRKEAVAGGYQVGQNWLESLATEGGISTLIAMLTGAQIDTGKLAPQGIQQFSDTFRSDETVWKLFGGAAGSTIASAIGSLDGFFRANMSFIRDDDQQYKMTAEDYLQPFLEITAANNLKKLYYGIQYNKLITKKEGYVSDVSAGQAVTSFLSGMQPTEYTTWMAQVMNSKYEKEQQSAALSQFLTEYRRFMVEPDGPTALTYMKNSFAILRAAGYPEDRIPSAVAIAIKGGDQSLIERSNRDFFIGRNVPTTRSETGVQSYINTLQQK